MAFFDQGSDEDYKKVPFQSMMSKYGFLLAYSEQVVRIDRFQNRKSFQYDLYINSTTYAVIAVTVADECLFGRNAIFGCNYLMAWNAQSEKVANQFGHGQNYLPKQFAPDFTDSKSSSKINPSKPQFTNVSELRFLNFEHLYRALQEGANFLDWSKQVNFSNLVRPSQFENNDFFSGTMSPNQKLLLSRRNLLEGLLSLNLNPKHWGYRRTKRSLWTKWV